MRRQIATTVVMSSHGLLHLELHALVKIVGQRRARAAAAHAAAHATAAALVQRLDAGHDHRPDADCGLSATALYAMGHA